jgi:hypothetical protein
VLKQSLIASAAVLLCFPAHAQQGEPPLRVNVLNVCTPSESEQKALAGALARVPLKPRFSGDFEIARGRSSTSDEPGAKAAGAISRWVRIRHDFDGSAFSNVQYSFSVDAKSMTETLVFRMREPKDVVQLSIHDSVTSGTPEQVLTADTPATRVRVERMGASSLALARCPTADQSAYEPLFSSASRVLREYRAVLRVRQVVPADLARLKLQ